MSTGNNIIIDEDIVFFAASPEMGGYIEESLSGHAKSLRVVQDISSTFKEAAADSSLVLLDGCLAFEGALRVPAFDRVDNFCRLPNPNGEIIGLCLADDQSLLRYASETLTIQENNISALDLIGDDLTDIVSAVAQKVENMRSFQERLRQPPPSPPVIPQP